MSAGRALMLLLVALAAWPSGRLAAQTDARLVEALRLAQSGQVDSGRTIVRRLLATLSPADSIYPEALLAAALVGEAEAGQVEDERQRGGAEAEGAEEVSSVEEHANLRGGGRPALKGGAMVCRSPVHRNAGNANWLIWSQSSKKPFLCSMGVAYTTLRRETAYVAKEVGERPERRPDGLPWYLEAFSHPRGLSASPQSRAGPCSGS